MTSSTIFFIKQKVVRALIFIRLCCQLINMFLYLNYIKLMKKINAYKAYGRDLNEACYSSCNEESLKEGNVRE